MSKYYQGYFKPTNPAKYKGDPTNIIYRSRWELILFSYLDKHKDVLKWSSEEIIIPYKSPIDGKWHRYFPDVFVEMVTTDKKKKKRLIEIKPKAQTKPPKPQKRRTKKYINEVYTWGINEAKWKAAKDYCKDQGWDFIIMTEDDLPV